MSRPYELYVNGSWTAKGRDYAQLLKRARTEARRWPGAWVEIFDEALDRTCYVARVNPVTGRLWARGA